MGKKRVLVGYGIDIDAVAGWLGSYGGEDSVSDISRGTTPSAAFNSSSILTTPQASGPATTAHPASSNSSKNTT